MAYSMKDSSILFCIPKRMSSIEGHRLYNYPLNIVIMRISLYKEEPAIYTFEYKPDLNLLGNGHLTYFNEQDTRFFIIYSYDPVTMKYSAEKFHGPDLIGIAEGKGDWDKFFYQAALLNPVVSEPCIISMI